MLFPLLLYTEVIFCPTAPFNKLKGASASLIRVCFCLPAWLLDHIISFPDQHFNNTSRGSEPGSKEAWGEGAAAAKQPHHCWEGAQPPSASPGDAQAQGHRVCPVCCWPQTSFRLAWAEMGRCCVGACSLLYHVWCWLLLFYFNWSILFSIPFIYWKKVNKSK